MDEEEVRSAYREAKAAEAAGRAAAAAPGRSGSAAAAAGRGSAPPLVAARRIAGGKRRRDESSDDDDSEFEEMARLASMGGPDGDGRLADNGDPTERMDRLEEASVRERERERESVHDPERESLCMIQR